jgi:hypothetical protein
LRGSFVAQLLGDGIVALFGYPGARRLSRSGSAPRWRSRAVGIWVGACRYGSSYSGPCVIEQLRGPARHRGPGRDRIWRGCRPRPSR